MGWEGEGEGEGEKIDKRKKLREENFDQGLLYLIMSFDYLIMSQVPREFDREFYQHFVNLVTCVGFCKWIIFCQFQAFFRAFK